MSDRVVAIFGGPTGSPERNEVCVEVLEQWLEMAKSGEITGVALAGLCHDGLGRYAVCGKIGGYSILGAVEMAKSDLTELLK